MQDPARITDIILRRRSSRTYRREPIEEWKKASLEAYIYGNGECPFGTASRFRLEAAKADDSSVLKGLGTYGMIKNAQAFIIGAVKNTEYHLEDYGFLMEKAILHATGLGLGSCWLGGTFRRSRFAERISAREDEATPAVVSLGYPARLKSPIESTVRFAAGSDNRKPWSELFFNGDLSLPLEKPMAGPYSEVLDMVRLAPSASNHQPWRIIKDENAGAFHFYIQRSRSYTINLKLLRFADLQRVDMGIAMCHFELAARELKLNGNWKKRDPGIEADAAKYVISWE